MNDLKLHLNLEMILAYVAGKMRYEEILDTEEHLAGCRECASRVKAHYIIRAHFDVIFENWTARSHAVACHKASKEYPFADTKALEEKRILDLTLSFGKVIEESAGKTRLALEKYFLGLYELFLHTFSFPTPTFSPVFGKGEVTLLSPFGKILPPVVFAWEPLKNAKNYIISVEETGWSRRLIESQVIASPEDLRIELGSEYTWNLEIIREDQSIEKISGFFSLALREEIEEFEVIERQLMRIKNDLQRYILQAAILEQKGFYQDAVRKFQEVYKLEPIAGIAYRIASCYDHLELEELRDRWNKEVLRQPKEE